MACMYVSTRDDSIKIILVCVCVCVFVFLIKKQRKLVAIGGTQAGLIGGRGWRV